MSSRLVQKIREKKEKGKGFWGKTHLGRPVLINQIMAGFLWGVMRSGFRWNWGKDLSSHQWVVFDSLISAAFLLGRVWISDLGRVALWQLRLGFGGNRRVRGRSEKKIKNKEKD